MKCPLESKSSISVVALPNKGPAVADPGWLSTATCPFELTATPSTSPRFSPGSSLMKSSVSNCTTGAERLSTPPAVVVVWARGLSGIAVSASAHRDNEMLLDLFISYLSTDKQPAHRAGAASAPRPSSHRCSY